MFGEKIAHGTPFRRAVEEGLLATTRSIRSACADRAIRRKTSTGRGARASRVIEAEKCWYKSHGTAHGGSPRQDRRSTLSISPMISTASIRPLRLEPVPWRSAGSRPGRRSRSSAAAAGLNLVGGDLVEVSPPFDPSGNTALIGANLLFEMLCVLPGVKYGA